jgi:DNA (cytosine-5)-methyltransferase 1
LGPPSPYARVLRGETNDPDDLSQPRHSNGSGLTGCQGTSHSPETTQRCAATPPGTYEPVSRFYRLTKDGFAPTLRAGTGPANGSFTAPRPIHPISPRCITVREGGRLHSFPDWFCFHPTKWHGFRQLGNSVPPFLARAVAKQVRSALTSR